MRRSKKANKNNQILQQSLNKNSGKQCSYKLIQRKKQMFLERKEEVNKSMLSTMPSVSRKSLSMFPNMVRMI